MTTKTGRRGFLSGACAAFFLTGCVETVPEEGEGEKEENRRPATITAYRVPEFRPNSTPTVPLERLDSGVIETAIDRANEPSDLTDMICYGGAGGSRTFSTTSMYVERDEAYEKAREALDSTPSVEMGDPYCFGGTVVEKDGDLYLVRMSE